MDDPLKEHERIFDLHFCDYLAQPTYEEQWIEMAAGYDIIDSLKHMFYCTNDGLVNRNPKHFCTLCRRKEPQKFKLIIVNESLIELGDYFLFSFARKQQQLLQVPEEEQDKILEENLNLHHILSSDQVVPLQETPQQQQQILAYFDDESFTFDLDQPTSYEMAGEEDMEYVFGDLLNENLFLK